MMLFLPWHKGATKATLELSSINHGSRPVATIESRCRWGRPLHLPSMLLCPWSAKGQVSTCNASKHLSHVGHRAKLALGSCHVGRVASGAGGGCASMRGAPGGVRHWRAYLGSSRKLCNLKLARVVWLKGVLKEPGTPIWATNLHCMPLVHELGLYHKNRWLFHGSLRTPEETRGPC